MWIIVYVLTGIFWIPTKKVISVLNFNCGNSNLPISFAKVHLGKSWNCKQKIKNDWCSDNDTYNTNVSITYMKLKSEHFTTSNIIVYSTEKECI